MSRRDWCIAIAIGLVLSLVIWNEIATGGGFVGGDTYPYFMPQKTVVADAFERGQLPLWHNLTSLGYPLHAESQAGVFYPTNQLLYRLFDINTAYNISILLHYWLAFVFAWRFARCQRLSMSSAVLAAVIFVYGWFPTRVSLEWSIIGGVFFPLTLWRCHVLLESPTRRNFAILAICHGIHLLAGHFALAFINQLTLIGYASCQIWQNRDRAAAAVLVRTYAVVPAAICVALLLASIQLLATMELKLSSQRQTANADFDPGYGHMPPLYVTQVVASWWGWHSMEITRSGSMQRLPGSFTSDTNKVEAHLYWGLLPCGLILLSTAKRIRRRLPSAVLFRWSVLSLPALIYSTGWLIPLTKHLPGFGFFIGPGRYTIVCAMGGAVVAGLVLDGFLRRRSRLVQAVVPLLIACVTLADLMASAKYTTDAVVLRTAPIDVVHDSWLHQELAGLPSMRTRLLAPGPNVMNLLGVSCVPQYLGIGPAEYFHSTMKIDTTPESGFPDTNSIDAMKRLAVTHVVTERSLGEEPTGLTLVKSRPDAFMNFLWARGRSPMFLYQVDEPAERVRIDNDGRFAWRTKSYTAEFIEIDVELESAGVVSLVELMYPGWIPFVDGIEQSPVTAHGIAREVAVPPGQHVITWKFRSRSIQIGAWVSAVSLIILLVVTNWAVPQSGIPESAKKELLP